MYFLAKTHGIILHDHFPPISNAFFNQHCAVDTMSIHRTLNIHSNVPGLSWSIQRTMIRTTKAEKINPESASEHCILQPLIIVLRCRTGCCYKAFALVC